MLTIGFYHKLAADLLEQLAGLPPEEARITLSNALFAAYSTGLAQKGAKAEIRESLRRKRNNRVAEEDALLDYAAEEFKRANEGAD